MAVQPLYILYTVFMVAMLLYFVCYVHGYMKSSPGIKSLRQKIIFLAIFVLTFKLKGGLNHITFLFRFRFVFLDGFSNFSVVWYPLFLKAVSYVILALLNSVLSQGKFEMCLLVIDGNYLIIDGGWLDFECIYRSVLFGFLKGKFSCI